jgi:hypothetical protein
MHCIQQIGPVSILRLRLMARYWLYPLLLKYSNNFSIIFQIFTFLLILVQMFHLD